jgi:hypothetical protein
VVDESVPEVAAGVAVSSLGKAVAKVSKLNLKSLFFSL